MYYKFYLFLQRRERQNIARSDYYQSHVLVIVYKRQLRDELSVDNELAIHDELAIYDEVGTHKNWELGIENGLMMNWGFTLRINHVLYIDCKLTSH